MAAKQKFAPEPVDSSFQWVPEGGAPNPPSPPSHLELQPKGKKHLPEVMGLPPNRLPPQSPTGSSTK